MFIVTYSTCVYLNTILINCLFNCTICFLIHLLSLLQAAFESHSFLFNRISPLYIPYVIHSVSVCFILCKDDVIKHLRTYHLHHILLFVLFFVEHKKQKANTCRNIDFMIYIGTPTQKLPFSEICEWRFVVGREALVTYSGTRESTNSRNLIRKWILIHFSEFNSFKNKIMIIIEVQKNFNVNAITLICNTHPIVRIVCICVHGINMNETIFLAKYNEVLIEYIFTLSNIKPNAHTYSILCCLLPTSLSLYSNSTLTDKMAL